MPLVLIPDGLGVTWWDSINIKTHQIAGHPGIFIGKEFLLNGLTVVDAAARERALVADIYQFLNPQGKQTDLLQVDYYFSREKFIIITG